MSKDQMVTPSDCIYPDWEGGLIKTEHIWGKDGYCIVCGETRPTPNKEKGESGMSTEEDKWWEEAKAQGYAMEPDVPKHAPTKREEIDMKWVKHVFNEGSRNHVMWWDGKGRHCKVKNCEVNRASQHKGIKR